MKKKMNQIPISSSILPTDVCWLQVKVFDYDEFYFLSFCLFHWKQFPYDFYVNIFSWNWTVTWSWTLHIHCFLTTGNPSISEQKSENQVGKKMDDFVGYFFFLSLSQHSLCLRWRKMYLRDYRFQYGVYVASLCCLLWGGLILKCAFES